MMMVFDPTIIQLNSQLPQQQAMLPAGPTSPRLFIGPFWREHWQERDYFGWSKVHLSNTLGVMVDDGKKMKSV